MHLPECFRYSPNVPARGPCAATRPTRSALLLAAALQRTTAYQAADPEPSEEELVEALRLVRDRLGEGVAAKLAAALGVDVLTTDDDNGVEDLAPSEQPLLGPIAALRAAPAAKREAGALFPLGQAGEHPGKTVSRRAVGLRAQSTVRAYEAGRAAAMAARPRLTHAELEDRIASLEAELGVAAPTDAPEVAAYAASGLLREARRMAQVYAASPAFVRATPLRDYIAAQLGPA